MPELSPHFRAREPSPIRRAQLLALGRPDRARLRIVNLAIGNVSLPLHPALRRRLGAVLEPGSPFAEGVVRYAPTPGLEETRRAFLHVIASAGCATKGLEVLVTDGGSMAMELMLLGTLGPGAERPLLVLDPTYSNYVDMARRIGARTVGAPRHLGADGRYSPVGAAQLDALVARERPAALLVIPADNPTGHHLPRETLADYARLAVRHDLWLVSDEAYRQLEYDGLPTSSVWALDEAEVPGITGRRISIESASKVFNACGLRVGALVTDHAEFFHRAVAEHTASLCSNVVGQWVFGALAEVPPEELRTWYEAQRRYYRDLLSGLAGRLREAVPGMVVSEPEAALYFVLDVGAVVDDGFDAGEFVRFAAERGAVELDGVPHTLLLAPLAGFQGGAPDPATRTQLRLACVEGADTLALVPELFRRLLEQFQAHRA